MARGSQRQVFQFTNPAAFHQFIGPEKSNLRELRKQGIEVQVRAYRIVFIGEPGPDFDRAVGVLSQMKREAEEQALSNQNRSKMVKPRGQRDDFNRNKEKGPLKAPSAKIQIDVQPKTRGQREYLDKIHNLDVVFGLGPAGTGKTFLAVAAALKALINNDVERIVITRPAVEAGERLGFLPGSFSDKVDPYLQPIYDALHLLAGKPAIEAMKRDGRIEIAPLAYMRGRTLANAFVLLDEAQNCTRKQLVMLLTRFGEGSKVVVTGDASQTDLYRGQSGLRFIVQALSKVPGIGIHTFGPEDVVRHPLVAKIVEALGDLNLDDD